MGVKIFYRFICDGCLRGSKTRQVNGHKLNNEIEDLLVELLKEGWGRMRRLSDPSLGDYCPDCVKAIQDHQAGPAAEGGKKAD